MKYIIRRAFVGLVLIVSGSATVYWSAQLYDWKNPADKGDSVALGLLSALLITIGIYPVFIGIIINMPKTLKRLRKFAQKVGY